MGNNRDPVQRIALTGSAFLQFPVGRQMDATIKATLFISFNAIDSINNPSLAPAMLSSRF